MGVASLVLGILSVVFSWCLWFLAIPLAIIGLPLGIIEREKSGMRTAGIVLNIIGLAISGLMLLFFILMEFAYYY